MRLATVQPRMHPTIDGNLAEIQGAIASVDADAVLFPELALTGFHRGLRELCDVRALWRASQGIQETVDRHGIAAVVGMPFGRGKDWHNAARVFTPGRPQQVVGKVGLTPSEASFFAPFPDRPTFDLAGVRTTVVFCREVLDDLELDADLILWPGYIQWAGDNDYLRAAQHLAQRTGAWMVQSNWPNSLNAPDTRGMGGSIALHPSGRHGYGLSKDAPSERVIDI